MPITKPIPDSVINFWKKVYINAKAKFSDFTKKQLVK